MGVTTAIDVIADFEPFGNIDAVIVGTGLGCLADSETFLRNCVTSGGQQVNPTPFIQSTFNTVAAQVALIKSLHCYNNTFSHRYISFESALTDAVLRIDGGYAANVLIGVVDEVTPTSATIMRRMKLHCDKQPGEGAVFMVISQHQLECSVASIGCVNFNPCPQPDALYLSKCSNSVWSGAVAEILVSLVADRQSATLVNDLGNRLNSSISVQCL
jgi:hypothetical protein